MQASLAAIYFLAALALTPLSIAILLPWLRKRAILDLPNERTNHAVPTPRGGGVGIVIVFLLLLGANAAFGHLPKTGLSIGLPLVALSVFALALISAVDDIWPIAPAFRLFAHAIVITLCALSLPAGQPVICGAVPLFVDRILVTVGWLWFINLYNFMDGIDGITGVETTSIAIGFLLVNAALSHDTSIMAVLLIGCSLGFLVYNWHPARIFFGDVGSIPIGFLVGALLIELAINGAFASAVILPAYYLVDSGLTLIRRLLKGEKVWRAHSQHAYQYAVRRGLRHDRVTLSIAAYNLLAVSLALAALTAPLPATILAYVAAMAWYLALKFGSADALLKDRC